MGIEHPRREEAVDRSCIRCHRDPRPGETYGPYEEGWDFTGICPECWNAITAEDEEDEG
jgi:hypothetical protein